MLTIITGQSASGKDALARTLIKDGFTSLISETTRPIREGEAEGVDYFFVTKEQFNQRLKEGRYLEYRSYDTLVNNIPDTWYYASPKLTLEPEKDYVVILDVLGAKEFIDYYSSQTAVLPVFIDAKDEVRKARAKQRGSFNQAEWDRRLRDDAPKFEMENVKQICSHIIDNNDISFEEFKTRFYEIYETFKREHEKEQEEDLEL